MQVLKRGSMIVVLLSVIAVLVAGCGSGGGGGSTPPPPSATGTFRLVNNTTYSINEIYVARTTSSSWGVKQNSNLIPSLSTFTLTSVPVGTWDSAAVIVATVSTYFSYDWNFSIADGGTFTTTVSDADFSGSLIVNNNSNTYSIAELYVSPSDYATAWGQINFQPV